jgi:predicted MFS family arabinose efflux permease
MSAAAGAEPATRGPGRINPDGLLAATLLALLATAGFFYVNIMPAIVSGLVDGLHFSARDAGRVGAANVYGAALGALSAVWLAQHVPWRRIAVVALLGLMSLDVLSLSMTTPVALALVRLAHGLAGGTLVGTAFLVISRTRVPERTFGVLVFVQYGLGGLALLVLPYLVALTGSRILFLVLGVFSLVTLLLLPLLPAYPRPSAASAQGSQPVPRSGLRVLALLSVLLFQAGNMALLAYIIELGRAYGLSIGGISLTLGVANWIGTAGTLLVVWLGLRRGRVWPIAVSAGAAIVGTWMLHWSGQAVWFVTANIVTTVAWAFCVPYLLGMCASFDRSGRSATLASFFSKVGLATGPFVASMLVGSGDWGRIIDASVLSLIASAACALVAARNLDGQRQGA